MTGPRILLLLAVLGVIGTPLNNEATAEELALIDYVKSNGGMVNKILVDQLDLLLHFSKLCFI